MKKKQKSSVCEAVVEGGGGFRCERSASVTRDGHKVCAVHKRTKNIRYAQIPVPTPPPAKT